MKNYSPLSVLLRAVSCLSYLLLVSCAVHAQTVKELTLQDLSAFDQPGESWKIVGGVTASFEKADEIKIMNGMGVLLNHPDEQHSGEDLYTDFEHGDIDLELEYMMPKGSNSGIYIQGRYEVQLRDSWTVSDPIPADNGGIYERWDESQPKGQKGSQGYAPRQNVSRAPGLWQHLKISFRAPRFDDDGKKTENARILSVELNGVTIHQDVELTGPTRGAVGKGEVALGPLRLQGDHGAVAFRNVKVTRYEAPAPELKELNYEVFAGEFTELPDLNSLSPVFEGSSEQLATDFDGLPAQFIMRYRGTIHVRAAGDYQFGLRIHGGLGELRIDDQKVIPLRGRNRGEVNLAEGELPFEIIYMKRVARRDPGLNMAVSATGLRKQWFSDATANKQNIVNPIYINAQEQPLLRSFRDLPNGERLTHAVSVGSLENVHYTYDLNLGNLVQVWRGKFLDTTPMWHSRGDGSSLPNGSVENLLQSSSPVLNKLQSRKSAWADDTTGTGFQPQGYGLIADNVPVFKYRMYGIDVRDKVQVISDGTGVERTLELENISEDLYLRLAIGKSIEELSETLFLVDKPSHYLRIDDPGRGTPFIRTQDGRQELLIPAQNNIRYSVLF